METPGSRGSRWITWQRNSFVSRPTTRRMAAKCVFPVPAGQCFFTIGKVAESNLVWYIESAWIRDGKRERERDAVPGQTVSFSIPGVVGSVAPRPRMTGIENVGEALQQLELGWKLGTRFRQQFVQLKTVTDEKTDLGVRAIPEN